MEPHGGIVPGAGGDRNARALPPPSKAWMVDSKLPNAEEPAGDHVPGGLSRCRAAYGGVIVPVPTAVITW